MPPLVPKNTWWIPQWAIVLSAATRFKGRAGNECWPADAEPQTFLADMGDSASGSDHNPRGVQY